MYDSISDISSIQGYLDGIVHNDSNFEKADFMQQEFEGLGYSVKRQAVNIPEQYSHIAEGHLDDNIIATYEGNSKSDSYVVLTAHHDKVYVGQGANDNGSGSAALLEIARLLKENNGEINVVFVSTGQEELVMDLFNMEEIVLSTVGSSVYVNSLSQEEKDNIAYNINMDVCGWGETISFVTADAYGKSDTAIVNKIEDAADELGLTYKEIDITPAWSDQSPFNHHKIPAISISRTDDEPMGPYSFSLPTMHTDDDIIENVSAEQISEVVDIVYRTLTQE